MTGTLEPPTIDAWHLALTDHNELFFSRQQVVSPRHFLPHHHPQQEGIYHVYCIYIYIYFYIYIYIYIYIYLRATAHAADPSS